MSDPLFHIVLLSPQIPNNTGNIGRTVMVTGCRLHIIHPIAFDIDEKAVRRAGLDYWHVLDVKEHDSWGSFIESESPAQMWLCTTKSEHTHWNASFQKGDYILFGSEQHGVSDEVHAFIEDEYGKEARIHLPMVENARSLNLATAVSATIYEALRQVSDKAPE